MKEEDLSRIKRYPIVEYLERKGIKPVRSTPAYALYHSPFREDTHPSFKVDTEKNLWIDYAEGKGGSIIDLCVRLEGCTLLGAIRLLGRNAPDYTACSSQKADRAMKRSSKPMASASGVRRLIEISDTLPPHLLKYLEEDRSNRRCPRKACRARPADIDDRQVDSEARNHCLCGGAEVIDEQCNNQTDSNKAHADRESGAK